MGWAGLGGWAGSCVRGLRGLGWVGLGWAAGLGWVDSWVCGFVGRSRVRVGELPESD